MSRKRSLSEILTIILAAVLVLALMAAFSPSNAGEIRLKPDAEVAGQIMKVRDIAEVSGFEKAVSDKILETSLGACPGKNKVRILTRSEIELRLEHRGIDLKKVMITGAEKTEVRPGKPVEELDDAPVRHAAVGFLNDFFSGKIRIKILEVDHAVVSGRSGKIYPDGECTIANMSDPEDMANVETVFVFVPVRNLAGEKVLMAVEAVVTRLRSVVRASRTIGSGRKISTSDLSIEDVPADAVTGEPLSLEQIVGARSGRFIKAGDVLVKGDIVLPEVVKKGDKIAVRVTSGMLEITTTAIALEAGSTGALIRVENPNSKGVYTVIVEGPGTARKE